MTPKERRSNYPTLEKDLYQLKDVEQFIQNERRHDELDRLREVREQKQVWLKTVLFCGVLNLILIGLAIYGWMTHGFS